MTWPTEPVDKYLVVRRYAEEIIAAIKTWVGLED